MLFGAHAYLATNPVAVAAPLVLQQLASATGLTASVFVRTGDSRAVVARVEGTHPLRYVLPIGQRLPLHIGAGRVLAAHMDEQELADLIDRVGDFSVADGRRVTAEEFRAELAAIRARGWCFSSNERVVGTASVAAPVFSPGDRCTTAIQVAGPAAVDAFVDPAALSVEVRQAAAALAARLS
jgi:IclR family acetate operon transcriptional repressor